MTRIPTWAWAAWLVIGPGAAAQTHPNLEQGFDPEKAYQFGEVDQVALQTGVLSIALPLSTGGPFPVTERLSYSLALTYSSSIWDLESEGFGELAYLRAKPDPWDNAGMGWQLSLGTLVGPGHPENGSLHWLYLSPDGGEHELWPTLHSGDADAEGEEFSRDGSYLRLRRNVAPGVHELDFPDGTTHRFAADPQTPEADDYRLTAIRDPFTDGLSWLNVVSIEYDDVAHVWTIADPHGREQRVYLEPRLYDGVARLTVDRVELTAFGATVGEFDFHYLGDPGEPGAFEILRDCRDGSGNPDASFAAPLLSSLELPDGTRWRMSYWNDLSDGTCRRGQIATLEYPTGGRIEYDYNRFRMPTDDPCEVEEGLGAGVIALVERTLLDGVQSNPPGTWTYGYSLSNAPETPDTCTPPGEAARPSEQLTVTVTTPRNDKTEHYFSVWPLLTDSPVVGASGGFRRRDYGLPFTRGADGIGAPVDGRYLSSRTFDCDAGGSNCQLVRSTYVVYEDDGGSTGVLSAVVQQNRRLSLRRTVYHDDGDRFVEEAFSDFDGLGHYRTAVESSDFVPGPTRTSFTHFHPGQSFPHAAGVVHVPPGDPWILGTYTERSVTVTEVPACDGTVSAQTAWEEACFEPSTGYLLRQRTLGSSAAVKTRLATDVVRVFERDASGNTRFEGWYGGDDAPGLSTGEDLCSLTLPAQADYRMVHEHQHGVRAKSRYTDDDGNPGNDPAALRHWLADRTIDFSTGLPAAVRTASSVSDPGLESELTYDALGRLTSVQPDQASAARESYSYPAHAGLTPAKAIHQTLTNDGATLLEESQLFFDGLGRPSRERRRFAAGSSGFFERFTFLEPMGARAFVSEWSQDGEADAAQYGVELADYDAFGRSWRTIRHTAPGSQQDAELRLFTGDREVKRTRWISLAFGSETAVDRFERFDHLGRLVEVSEPSATGTAQVPTRYGYDVGDRLTRAATDAPPGTADQVRCWQHDARGFLLAETHPEKGASGNGSVTFPVYDALGHVRRRVDNGVTLAFALDRAARPTSVDEVLPIARPWKAWSYATANATGNWKLGKVETATGYNYPEGLGTVRFEETFHYGGPGGRATGRDLATYFNSTLADTFTHEEAFDPAGRRTGIVYPSCTGTWACDGTSVEQRTIESSYAYGFLSSVVEAGAPPRPWASSIAWHPSGLWKEVVRHDGMVDEQGRPADRRARPSFLHSRLGSSIHWTTGGFGYDRSGNVTSMTPGGGIPAERFRYDRVERLAAAELAVPEPAPPPDPIFADGFESGDSCLWDDTQPPAGCLVRRPDLPWGSAWQISSQAYLYDVYGNLLETTTDGVPLELPASGSTNRLTVTGVCYDARGNLVRYSPGQACGFVQTVGDRFDFDALDRMAARRRLDEEESYRFLYTADDERVATFVDRESGDELFWTLRDLGGRELREFYGAGTAKRPFRDHVYRGELLLGLYEIQDQVEVHLALDHLGSPRKETLWDRTEATVTLSTERKYYPFGTEALAVSQYGHTRRFTGHERDLFNPAGTDDDLDYMHARFRSPLTGRFLSTDPIPGHPKRPQSWNQYSYVQGNPLSYTDPAGLLLKAMSDEARTDMCALVGPDCDKHLSFADDGTVTVTATKDELAANESLNLFNDLASSDLTYGAYVGDKLPTQSGFISLGGGKGDLIATNVSKTPDNRVKNQQLPPAGFSGVAGVFSGLTGVASGVNGAPAHRPSALFHELAENYLRTEKLMQWKEAHPGAIERENLLRSQRPELNQYLLGAGTYRRVIKN